MKEPIRMSEAQLRREVQRIEAAQLLMHDANSALRRRDTTALVKLGFSAEHIAELQRPTARGIVGFPDSAFANNEMTLRALERKLAAFSEGKVRGQARVSIVPDRALPYDLLPT